MTSFRQPPQIEPLADTSWKRIENSVFATLDRETAAPVTPVEAPSRWLRTAAVFAVIGAAAALLLLFLLQDRGDVDPAQASRVETQDAPTRLTVGDASLTVLPESAVLVTTSPGERVLVVIERGGAEFRVPRRSGRPPFVVYAGDVRVEVVGTRFAVSRIGNSALIHVIEGEVKVSANGKASVVAAGQTWPTTTASAEPEPPAPPEVDPPAPPEVATPDAGAASARKASKTARHVTRAPDAAERFRTAARLQRSDPDAAAAIYGQLVKERGSWAPLALFEHAQLEADRKRFKTARRLLQTYLRRYPRGGNAEDARALLDQLP